MPYKLQITYFMDSTTSKTTPSGANDGTNNLINTTRSCVVGGVCKHRATGVCKHHQAKKVVSSYTYTCHLYTYKRMHSQSSLFIHL